MFQMSADPSKPDDSDLTAEENQMYQSLKQCYRVT